MSSVDHHARPVPDAEVTARAEELQRLIDRMGEINLTAIEEYEETPSATSTSPVSAVTSRTRSPSSTRRFVR